MNPIEPSYPSSQLHTVYALGSMIAEFEALKRKRLKPPSQGRRECERRMLKIALGKIPPDQLSPEAAENWGGFSLA